MLFDTVHILYIVLTFVTTIGSLIGLKFIKEQKWKDFALKSFALVTVLVHFSLVWTSYLQTGTAMVTPSILFPIFFCNLAMWMLLVAAFWKNKESKLFKWIATFAAYAGIIGALVTTFYPDFYIANPDVSNWMVLRSMIDHTTMMIGCLYLFVGGYIEVRVFNVVPFVCGLLFSGVVGLINNGIFSLCGLPAQNSMYLQKPAIEGVPFLSCYVIGLMAVALVFIVGVIYEFIALKKEDRWYNHIHFKNKQAQNDETKK